MMRDSKDEMRRGEQTRLGVLVAEKHLWGTVPARGDVVCHVRVAACVLDGVERARKAKVADLGVAVGVHKDVPGFLLRVQVPAVKQRH